jgi:hypothetical protein
MELHGLLLRQLYILHVDNIHTSQEAHPWNCTISYGDSFLYFLCLCYIKHRINDT